MLFWQPTARNFQPVAGTLSLPKSPLKKAPFYIGPSSKYNAPINGNNGHPKKFQPSLPGNSPNQTILVKYCHNYLCTSLSVQFKLGSAVNHFIKDH
ncbi:hypothetical protein BGP_3792 [Beggiatoa sp. PS]|nr:hypothetical protein BGP_3792 [Beggiatoa sp. PS]